MPTENTDQFVNRVDNELFDGVIDNIDAWTDRMQAVSSPQRLSLVFTVYKYEHITQNTLKSIATSLDEDTFTDSIDTLLNYNFIARRTTTTVGNGEHTVYYRITEIGRDIIDYIIMTKGEESIHEYYNTKTDESLPQI